MKIIRNAPAGRWGEAFPLGNGHMGAMVYGKVGEEQIDLSELTFFSGNKSACDNQPEAATAFEKMRFEAAAGDYEAMTATAKHVIGRRGNYGTNLPVGQLLIRTNHQEQQVADYARSLDLEKGITEHTYEYEGEGKGYRMECTCYTSHDYKVMVYRMTAGATAVDLDISFASFRPEEGAVYERNQGIFTCQALESMHSDGTTGVKLQGGFRIQTDGEQEADSSGLHIRRASKVLLYLAMITDFGRPAATDYGPAKVEQMLAAAEAAGYETITEVHQRDMKALYQRSKLSVSGTDVWVGQLAQMYQMGRYLLYSSSRADSLLPAHLQGIWNDNVACRIGWTCDMHLDVNTQMNYWPAEVTGIAETTQPLFRWISEELAVNGRRTASQTYGYPGWAAELVSNAWGFAAPYWAEPLTPCPACGIWTITQMWEHYLYSQDREYLAERAFPVIEEATRFFEAYVFEKDGYVTAGPSISPENSFVKDGQVYQSSIGPTFEILMIRELFSIYARACDVLERESDLLERVWDKLPRLLPYRILPDGSLAEWAHDYAAADPQHRHTSHLLGVFPFGQITPEQTELAQAVIRSLEDKMSPEENWEDTGWARSMMMLYEARLLRPGQAYRHIKAMLANLLEPNGMIIHPPTRGAGSFSNVYELDGNTGLTSCIAEMLLQSHREYLHILPCLPEEWSVGKITGLQARGNVEVTIDWNEQRTEVYLKAGKGGEYRIRYRGHERRIMLRAEQETWMVFWNLSGKD